MSTSRRVSLRFMLFVGLVVVGVLAAKWKFEAYERAFHLSFVPDALGVTVMTYSSEESSGFGPGANESGIRVYPLPEFAVVNARSGLFYFEHMPQNPQDSDRGWRGTYRGWRETPVVVDEQNWPTQGSKPKALDYICRYGVCAEVDPALIEEVDAIINSPGSYYAYGRIGVIIVSPSMRMVVYLFNG